MGNLTAAARQKAYQVRERNAILRADRFKNKRTAYQAGYKTGYTRAFRAWKVRNQQLMAKIRELLAKQ